MIEPILMVEVVMTGGTVVGVGRSDRGLVPLAGSARTPSRVAIV